MYIESVARRYEALDAEKAIARMASLVRSSKMDTKVLAKKAGVSRNTISIYRAARTERQRKERVFKPRIETVVKICHALGVNVLDTILH